MYSLHKYILIGYTHCVILRNIFKQHKKTYLNRCTASVLCIFNSCLSLKVNGLLNHQHWTKISIVCVLFFSLCLTRCFRCNFRPFYNIYVCPCTTYTVCHTVCATFTLLFSKKGCVYVDVYNTTVTQVVCV